MRSMPSRSIAFGAGLLLGGCAGWSPRALPIGTPLAEARSVFGLTGEHRLPDGGTRLEFARGSFGAQTEMLDFDPAGRLVGSHQALTEANFKTIQPGMTSAEVRMRLGRPAEVFNVGWQRLQVWNYRYAGGDCVWYQVSIDQGGGRVKESGLGTDPSCDAASSRD